MAKSVEKRIMRKGAWSPQEDQKLTAYIKRYGIWNWAEMAKPAGLQRSGKSCRLRWVNYLRPGIKHGNFTKEEEETIIDLHERLGNRCSLIASRLHGITDNEINNHWNAHLCKRFKYDLNILPESDPSQISDAKTCQNSSGSISADGLPSSSSNLAVVIKEKPKR